MEEFINLYDGHQCNCLPECRSVSYAYSVSQVARSELYESNVRRAFNISATELTRNYVMVRLFFSTLTYREIVVSATYNFMALLSDIGGALGLLLGATLLTVYEIGEFVCELVCDWLRAWKRRNRGVVDDN